jgi:hypothetical protein
MINPLFAASYECGRRLVAAGCPLDYLQDLPRNLAAFRKTLELRQLGGYVESRVFALGSTQTCYLIGLRLHSELPRGMIISDWSFSPPWEDHVISWDYDAREMVPEREHASYESVFDSRLSAVLNDGRLLARGHPIEGLLCGCAYQAIPDSCASGATVSAKLTVTDNTGRTFALRIALAVDRSAALARSERTTRRAGRIFDHPDFVDRKSKVGEEQQIRREAHGREPMRIRREASGGH